MSNPSAHTAMVAKPVNGPAQPDHISVCICTLNRPLMLGRALARLQAQETDGLFSYSIVVSDNDAGGSAEAMARQFSGEGFVPITYCVEPQKNIALARNNAVAHAQGNFIAFIDDDEFPEEKWLLHLFNACRASGADGVLGPVKPYFATEPPHWVTEGRFFDRPQHPPGYSMAWEQSRTGNVLFKREVLDDLEIPFRSTFDTAGEDMDFFRRAMEKGRRFIWCSEAVAFEEVPKDRCTRKYLLRRALLRGSNYYKHPENRMQSILKSLIAVPAYTLALPVLAPFGQHVFLKYLIKLLDHGSRLLAFLGLSLVTDRHT